MSIATYNLSRDVVNTEVLTKTNYEITSATAAQERNINSFVMEATSTGFLVNAKGTTTSTPLSAAFRNISNYFFSSSAANRIPVAQNNVAINKVSFISLNMLKRSVFFTRAFNQEYNYTNNPTAIANASLGSISSNLTGNPTSFITTIGLYNDDNELVAVAKTAPPVKKDFDTEKVFAVRLQY